MGGTYTIHTFFNAEQVIGVINAVVMLVGGASPDSEFQTLIRVAAMIGLFLAITYGFCKARGEEAGMYLVMVAIFYATLFTPRVTVTVEDHGAGAGAPVPIDNVPLGLAFFASTTSQIGYYLTSRTETFFALPDTTLSISQSGLLGAARALREAQSAAMPDPILAQDMINFMRDCVNPELVQSPLSMNALMASRDIWYDISSAGPLNLINPGRMVVLAGNASASDCATAYTLIDNRLAPAATTEFQRISRMLFPSATPAAANTLLGSMLPAAEGLIMTASASAADAIRQRMMINMLNDTSANMAQVMNDPAAAQTALAQSMAASSANTAYVVMAKIAQETLPIIRNAIELVVLGVFPIVLVLIIIAGTRGGAVLRSYVMTMLWVQLWAPLYAIVNYVGTMAGAKSLKASLAGIDGVSIANAAQLLNTSISSEAVAGLLTVSVPMIALAIIKGGETAMTGITSGLAQPGNQASSKAGEHGSAGNYNLGNTSWGNHSAYNTATNSHRSGYSMTTGTAGEITSGDGTIHHHATPQNRGTAFERSFTPSGGNAGINVSGGGSTSVGNDQKLTQTGGLTQGASATLTQGQTATLTKNDAAVVAGALVKGYQQTFGGGQSWGDGQTAAFSSELMNAWNGNRTIGNTGEITSGGNLKVSGSAGNGVNQTDSRVLTGAESVTEHGGAAGQKPAAGAPQKTTSKALSLADRLSHTASKVFNFGLSGDYGMGARQVESEVNQSGTQSGGAEKENAARQFNAMASAARMHLGSEATTGQRAALETTLGAMAKSVDAKYGTELKASYAETSANTDGRTTTVQAGATADLKSLTSPAVQSVAAERGIRGDSQILNQLRTNPEFQQAVAQRAGEMATGQYVPQGQVIRGPDGTSIKPISATPQEQFKAGLGRVQEQHGADKKEAEKTGQQYRGEARDTASANGAPAANVVPNAKPAEDIVKQQQNRSAEGLRAAGNKVAIGKTVERLAAQSFDNNKGAIRLANTAFFGGIGENGMTHAQLREGFQRLADNDPVSRTRMLEMANAKDKSHISEKDMEFFASRADALSSRNSPSAAPVQMGETDGFIPKNGK